MPRITLLLTLISYIIVIPTAHFLLCVMTLSLFGLAMWSFERLLITSI